jgi:hypothetical protein
MLTGLGNSDLTNELISRDLSNTLVLSKAILVVDSIGFSASISVSGAPIGIVKLQASNFFCNKQEDVLESSWGEIKGSSQNVALIGSYIWNYANAHYKWIRLSYTKVSGYGNIDHFHITAKR